MSNTLSPVNLVTPPSPSSLPSLSQLADEGGQRSSIDGGTRLSKEHPKQNPAKEPIIDSNSIDNDESLDHVVRNDKDNAGPEALVRSLSTDGGQRAGSLANRDADNDTENQYDDGGGEAEAISQIAQTIFKNVLNHFGRTENQENDSVPNVLQTEEGPTNDHLSTATAIGSPDIHLQRHIQREGGIPTGRRSGEIYRHELTPMFLPFHKQLQQMQFAREHNILLDVNPARDVIEQVFAPASSAIAQHKLDVLEVIQGWEGDFKYRLALDTGALATATETAQGVSRALLGSKRPFKLYVHLKNPKTPLLLVQRPFKLFRNYIIVRGLQADGQPGDVIGHIRKKFSLSRRKFFVTDEEDKMLYEISSTRISRVFGIYNDQGIEVGRIKKKWSGLMREIYTDADSFAIRFPLSATSMEKCLLFSALFLIDYTYYNGASQGNMGTTYF